MTRANLNYMYSSPSGYKTVYRYWNGDQYPSGLRDFYHVLDFINSDWTPKAFRAWVKENYPGDKPIEIPYPAILYDTAGMLTDYTFLFEATFEPYVRVFNWGKNIFEGSPAEFAQWIELQE